jgi:hypothetical protein
MKDTTEGRRFSSLRTMGRALRWRPGNHMQVWVAVVIGWILVITANEAAGRPFADTLLAAALMILVGLSESYYLRRRRATQPDS